MHPGHNSGYVVTNPGDLMYYGLDANVKYSFKSLIKSKVIDPSLRLGGYTFLGDNSYGTVNPGAGLTFGLLKMLVWLWKQLIKNHLEIEMQ